MSSSPAPNRSLSDRPLSPGGVIGILGGGQLGRMLSLAAARLGFKTHIYCPQPDCSASFVSAAAVIAPYEDEGALSGFLKDVDVVTYEFENIPIRTAEFVAAAKPLFPSPFVLSITQDRLTEKEFLKSNAIRTAPFLPVSDTDSLRTAIGRIGTPAVLKARRHGYDGKGQRIIRRKSDSAAAWEDLGRDPALLEGFIKFRREFSVVGARSLAGDFIAYDIPENIHKDHILHQSLVPADMPAPLAGEACNVARTIADRLDYVGILAVEFFDTAEGPMVNEIAPRVHNSGHWTLDACRVSQFEQHIRAICGWPLGAPDRHSDAVMTNILGQDYPHWPSLAADPGVALHLYDKGEPRDNRKVGHYTKIAPLGSGVDDR